MKIVLKGNTSQNGTPTPSSPIPVQVVSGDNEIKVEGKNLFDKDNANVLNANIDYSNNKISTSDITRLIYIQCKPNTTYTISKILSSRFVVGTTNVIPSANVSIIDKEINNSATSITITTSANANYLSVFFYHSSYDTLTPQEILNTIQIEKGNQSSNYTPYVSQSYPISLGDIELCKIGTYQDKIDKSTGKNLVEDKITNGTIGSTGNIGVNASYDMFIAKVEENKTYTVTTDENSLVCGFFYNKPTTGSVSYNSSRIVQSSKTFTAPITGYVAFRTNVNYATPMINEGTTALPYEPYGTGWYLKKEIGKYTFTGNETWTASSYGINSWGANVITTNYDANKKQVMCEVFKGISANDRSLEESNTIYTTSNTVINIRNTTLTTSSAVQSATNGKSLYYALTTPTYETITDTTLISQLEALKKSYESVTNISQVNNDLPFELSVTALEVMS